MAKQKVETSKKHKCPPHHFIINSSNVGHCKYCPAVKDFGELLINQGVFVSAGRRGAKASAVTRNPSNKKRGRKSKYA